MRLLLLVLVGCLCSGLALGAESWSGRIVCRQYVQRPETPRQQREQLQAFIQTLTARIQQQRQWEREAPEAAQNILRNDIIAMEADLASVRAALGGTHEQGESVFYLKQAPLSPESYGDSAARVRAEINDRIVWADWGEGLLRGRNRWQDNESALPLAAVTVVPSGEENGDPHGEKATRRLRLGSGQNRWRVDYLPDLPNPWAGVVTAHTAENDFLWQWAAVPGLPVHARRELEGGGYEIMEVTVIEQGAQDAELFDHGR